MYERQCSICGSTYEAQRFRFPGYCSPACRSAGYRLRQRLSRAEALVAELQARINRYREPRARYR